MRSTFTPKQVTVAIACALALGLLSATANAQVRDINEAALLFDSQGAPVMSGTGLCWHTAYGPAPAWTEGCHVALPAPAPVAQYVAPVATPIATPEPTPAPVAVAAAAPLVVYEKVAFDANVLFDSSKSELRPAGRDTLD